MSLLSHGDLMLRWICSPPPNSCHSKYWPDLYKQHVNIYKFHFPVACGDGSSWTGGILLFWSFCFAPACGSTFPMHPFLIPSTLPPFFCLRLLVFGRNKLLFMAFSTSCGHHQTQIKGKPLDRGWFLVSLGRRSFLGCFNPVSDGGTWWGWGCSLPICEQILENPGWVLALSWSFLPQEKHRIGARSLWIWQSSGKL